MGGHEAAGSLGQMEKGDWKKGHLGGEWTLQGSSCAKVLKDWCYHSRHDKLLNSITEAISKAISASKAIAVIKAGEKPRPVSKSSTAAGLLHPQGTDDISQPGEATQDTIMCCPDTTLISETTKQFLMLQLTVPWEERTEEANDRKRANYQDIPEESCREGWKAWGMPIEVDTRGFARQSFCKAYGALGITGMRRMRVFKSISEAAECVKIAVGQMQ